MGQGTMPENVTEQVKITIETIEKFVNDPASFAQLPEDIRTALLHASGRLSRPARDEIRIRNKYIDKARRKQIVKADRDARATTGIREARLNPIFEAPLEVTDTFGKEVRYLNSPRNCYVCKAEFDRLHFFYDSMCPKCAD